VLGTLVGVLPGIGPTSGIAILLPLTGFLPPAPAIIMLAAIYYGAMYGGSTTAILVNIPVDVQGGKIRGLAVVHPTRLPGLPDIPTVKEAGFPDLDVVGWQGLAGPKNLLPAIVAKWNALLEEASKDPAFLEQAAKLSKVVAYKGPDAYWQFQERELKKYLPLATKMGIRK
jgi:tripartite-type tricarboxylate transporter receptor subunit TctC